jgi:hypothetical protein
MASRRHKPGRAPTREKTRGGAPPPPSRPRFAVAAIIAIAAVALVATVYFLTRHPGPSEGGPPAAPAGPTGVAAADGGTVAAGTGSAPSGPEADVTSPEVWTGRALLVSRKFHEVYTPCWEGAYGAFGDAHLFRATGDSSLLRFHAVTHDLTAMCAGTWVDDRAWVCLAELEWWRVTGRTHMGWIADAVSRYDAARAEGRLSDHEGYWSWYNWSPAHRVNEPIFTNSNMNQLVAVACGLYEATGRKRFLDDALLVWNGDGRVPGIEATLYRGNGLWEGREGRAAFGKELPWGGLAYASIGAALYRATGDRKYREIAVATVRRIMDPRTGWVDPENFYQIRMDGNGNFVQFLLDAWEIAPAELSAVPGMVRTMLQHVWTNDRGTASVVLHRGSDHGIRNGWNPRGGEEGYGVDEVGTVHAQGEAAKAFGYYADVAEEIRKGIPPQE